MTKNQLPSYIHHFQGSALGTFVGDAMGREVEGWSWEQIKAQHGILKEMREGLYTDDTEMMIGIMESLKSVFTMSRSVKAMVLVAFLGSFGTRMVMDFLSLYALKVLNFSNTQLGLVSTTMGVIALVLSMPGGMLSDRFGSNRTEEGLCLWWLMILQRLKFRRESGTYDAPENRPDTGCAPDPRSVSAQQRRAGF